MAVSDDKAPQNPRPADHSTERRSAGRATATGQSRARGGDLLPGTLDMMILRVLCNGSNHGYGVARRIQQMSEQVLRVEEGSLYPALHRMEKRGLLTSDWQRSESNRRAKYYQLTPRGQAQLETDQQQWASLSAAVSRVMSSRLDAAGS